jgi:hypothetical protein
MPRIGMPARIAAGLTALALLGPGAVAGQQQGDTSFVRMQKRGRMVMGVDQYASAHRFDDLPDGGRIELQTDPGDSSSVRAIRGHLARISRAFAAGDFSDPMLVHAETVPGTGTMSARRKAIAYQFHPLPGGGEVRIVTRDAEALRAIHEFLAFQRREHRAAGRHEH